MLIALLCSCGPKHRDPAAAKGALGKATGDGMAAAIEAAAATVEPWRCARMGETVTGRVPDGWTLDGQTLRGGAAKKTARVAFVAEARGTADKTVAAIAALRAQLDADPVDAVVTLGGMGATRDEIERSLEPLAHGAPWLVVAIPSDREPVAAHREAIAELAATGAPIVDGSQVRVLDLPTLAIGTVPGAPYPERLGAGSGGCVRDDADVALLLAALTAIEKKPHVVALQTAPRGSTDLAPGGIHAGDPALARVLAATPVELVVHGAVDDASDVGALRAPWAAGTTAAAVGAIDATVRYRGDGTRVLPNALLLTVGERELTWKPLSPRVVP